MLGHEAGCQQQQLHQGARLAYALLSINICRTAYAMPQLYAKDLHYQSGPFKGMHSHALLRISVHAYALLTAVMYNMAPAAGTAYCVLGTTGVSCSADKCCGGQSKATHLHAPSTRRPALISMGTQSTSNHMKGLLLVCAAHLAIAGHHDTPPQSGCLFGTQAWCLSVSSSQGL